VKSPTLSLSKIGPESDVLLRNLFEYYVHDMAEWFDIDTQPDGRYSYDTALIWERGNQPYLAKVGDSIAGFAVVGSALEWLGRTEARDVNEFFVLRRFRRRGFGRSLATLLWEQYPGEWLVRVLETNTPAVLFWRSSISRHSLGTYEEEQRIVNGRSWRFFRFATGIQSS
jgi:predicted acetyltransferase